MKIRSLFGVCLGLALSIYPATVSGQTDYFALFMEGKKVGHSVQSRVVSDGKVTTSETVSITISRLGIPLTIEMAESSIETVDGKPIGFEVVQQLGILTTKTTGTIGADGTVYLTTTSPDSEQKSTFEWPKGAVMSEGLRLLTLKHGLKQGLEYSTKMFSPGMLQAVDAKVRIGAMQKVDLLGRVVPLTEVMTLLSMPGTGEIPSISYVDEELRPQKTITNIAGMQMEMIACAKEFALGENDVLELIDKMFVTSPEPLGDLSRISAVSYLLAPIEDANLVIPESDNQKVRRLEDGKVIVTVRPMAAPSGVKFPYKGKDKRILVALEPGRYVQSDHKQIIELGRQAIGNAKDVAEAIKRIESFVADYIENKSLSVGYASAAEVATSREGDCSEFAVLTAALCRAVGIPAQVVVGIAYVADFSGFEGFGGHAWVQAYAGDRWIGLDAAFKSAGLGGYDAGHIALAVGNGEPADFLNIASVLGQFKIEKVVVE